MLDEKVYVIGDVHGCYHTLLALLNQIPKNSRVIFVGDLCDRGLYTKEVIQLLIDNNYEAIRGNHDNYMINDILKCLDGKQMKWNTKEYMGGKNTIKSYKNDLETLKLHLKWLKQLPRYILVDNFFITHGFCLPYFKRRDLKSSHMGLMTNRISDEQEWGWDWEDGYDDYEVINIFGHQDYDEVYIGKNYYGIDTGCVYGRKLTAIELPSMKIYEEKLNKIDIE